MKFTEKQNEAIENCLNKNKSIVAVTGGAGTGKTTIIKEVVKSLIEQGKSFSLAAPTGKAAKRIKESTGFDATTLHKLLEYPNPEDKDKHYKPNRNKFHRLEADYVLVDEYAMVNAELHNDLFEAIKNGGCVRCFGDLNQLTPIETEDYYKKQPSRFWYLLDKFCSTKLDIIHRQGNDSSIILNANRIVNGEMPFEKNDFRMFSTKVNSPIKIIEDIVKNDPNYYEQSKQIITVSNTGFVGTRKLNQMIQEIRFGMFNNDYTLIDRSAIYQNIDMRLYRGDKIIFTKNDYNVGFFNGETGIVTDFYENKIIIDLGDRVLEVPSIAEYVTFGKVKSYNPQIYIDLGYVITTHKSQGSEYEDVIYVLNRGSSFLQNRRNFYTAITRAKNKVLLVYDDCSIRKSLKEKE